jgi:hypothetical protein
MAYDGLEIREYDWREIRQTYRELVGSEKAPEIPYDSRLSDLVDEWRTARSGGWSGATGKQMLGWLASGYQCPKIPKSQRPDMLDGHRARWRWTDDPSRGQYQHEAAMTGDPSCYLARDRRRSTAGIRVEIGTVFSSGIRAATVAEYGRWVGSVLRTLEAAGYDLDVSVVADTEGLYGHGSDARTFRAKIKCSSFGKRTLFRDWSALFSPGGYRHLCFMAWTLPEREKGHAKANYGLGHGTISSATAWTVDFEQSTRTLSMIPKYTGNDFPMDDMTRQLAEAFK